MKKILTLVLAVSLCISFAGCGDDDSSKKDSSCDSKESASSTDDTTESSEGSSEKSTNETADVFGKPYDTAIKNYFTAIQNGDGEGLMNSTPLYLIEYMETQSGDDFNVDEYFEDIGNRLTENLERQYGTDIKVSFKIKEDVEFTEDKLREMEKNIEAVYSVKVSIMDAYKVKIKSTIKGSDSDDADTATMTVANIGGTWYITDGGIIV